MLKIDSNKLSEYKDKLLSIFSSRRSDSKIVLLHKNIYPLTDIEGIYDIVLAPSLYIMKIEDIPFKYAFQAKKIASSILDEFTEPDKKYTYEVFQSDDRWVFVAYDTNEVLKLTRDAGLRAENIGNLYFAEQFREYLNQPVNLGNDRVLATIDNTVVELPKKILKGRVAKEFHPNTPRAEKSFGLKISRSSTLPQKPVIVISSILIVLALLFTIEALRYKKASNYLERKLESALDRYPSLQSGIMRKNIYTKYKNIDTRQREIRDTIKKIASLINKRVKLDSLDINSRRYKAVLSSSNIKDLFSRAKNRGLNAKMIGNRVLIEGSW